MNKRKLGLTDLEVTSLGFGAMEIGKLDYSDAEKLLNEVLDLGINYIDSSPCYGVAEEYIGKAISNRRDEFILATKCGCNVDGQGRFMAGPDHIWTSEQLHKNIDRSLQLLKTDYIDVWQLHGIMPDYLEGGRDGEVLQAAEQIKKSGKVRHIAFSCRNGAPGQPLYPARFGYQACCEMLPWKKFEVIQLVYGALTRTNEKMISEVAKEGVGVICRGAMKQYFEDDAKKLEQSGLNELFDSEESEKGFLLRFTLSHPGIASVIVGTKDMGHLRSNVAAAERGGLSEEIWSEAKMRLSRVGVVPER